MAYAGKSGLCEIAIELIVEERDGKYAFAFMDEGELSTLWQFDPNSLIGRIYRARIASVETNIDGAFLDIGDAMGKAPFVQGRELRASLTSDRSSKLPLTSIAKEGAFVLVQGIRDASAHKGPRMSTRVRLDGKFLSLRPFARQHSVSPRMQGKEREQLYERLAEKCPGGFFSAGRLALTCDDKTLSEEANGLIRHWRKLCRSERIGQLPGVIHPVAAIVYRALDVPVRSIIAAKPAITALLLSAQDTLSALDCGVEILPPQADAFVETGVEDTLALLQEQEVPLPNGGKLIIERTAACTAIDVDSGGDTALSTNLHAAYEVARQVRLRNIGGTIIVDFVDLSAPQQRHQVERAVRKSFRDDPASPQILPISQFGICQISRSRHENVKMHWA